MVVLAPITRKVFFVGLWKTKILEAPPSAGAHVLELFSRLKTAATVENRHVSPDLLKRFEREDSRVV